MENINELKSAFTWGTDCIKAFKEKGEQVPELLYERTLALAAELIKELEIENGG